MAKVRLGRASKDALAGALFVVFTILIACSRPAAAGGERASASQTGYDPLAAFAPLSLPDPVTPYRSADGARGPAFWQNRADYLIRAHLDTITHTLSAEESIRYTNNSPSRLDCLWIHLDQNIYRSDSRARVINARELQGSNARELQGSTSGYTLDSVEIEHNGKRTPALTLISDTRLQIRLEQPLAPGGGKIGVLIRYHYTIPGEFGGRTAHAASRNGEIYDIAQWYPRMAVFDDLRGWDTLPYLGAEFYLEYGDFDYYVTVPADLLVAGSGELQNPEQVLTPLERSRLAQARDSDGTVMIRTAEEAGSAASTDATRTWHFRMHDTRDVAFAASRAFLWDAARIRLPDGKRSLAMSFYPVESAGAGAWGRSTEYLKDAVQNFSRRWAPYPYPTAVAVAGPVTGMEYPGMVFDGASESGKVLFWLTVHEIGHCWFPMMVGSNERRDQWIDEGFNTFIDVMESDDFDHGEFGPKRDAEYAPGGGNPADEILPILADPAAPILLLRNTATRSRTSSRRLGWCCCASRSSVRSASILHFASSFATGPFIIRRHRISSAPCRAPPVKT